MAKFFRRHRKSDYSRLIIIIFILLALIALYWWTPDQPKYPPVIDVDDETIALVYRGKPLEITRHARCRMECRFISRREVADLLENARENPARARPNDSPCPSRAYEGRSLDGQQVRMVIAECETAARLVTVIDLGNDHQCDCN